MTATGADKFPNLYRVVLETPAIDNHAHPLLKEMHRDAVPFEGLISEASGDALFDAVHTVACFRATKELALLYGLEDLYRSRTPYKDLCNINLQASNIACLLLDDGLDYKWHVGLAKGGVKRIARVETIAETIISDLFTSHGGMATGELFSAFEESFQAQLQQEARSADVVAFKSAICYRTGLAVDPTVARANALQSFSSLRESHGPDGAVRVQNKSLNDWIVVKTAEAAAQAKIPVQFHTGLGDNDLQLGLATPSLMQPLIHAHPQTNFVLLHASYPFTREAGYLASVYSNVYLDFGRRGQEAALRQAFELCPTNKIMWSTDGHWWPESFYLGSHQARSALFKVLAEMVHDDDLAEHQAILIAQKALFHNANDLYKLGLTI
ncbi:amidohydrolase-domain-containing protein [Coprinopsis sp. MPI-PUGE-AT-0042]|nr:amidohydrolase-domain-containing protein [Coprinopsis sp. MPI-PUGE-AT-0042]